MKSMALALVSAALSMTASAGTVYLENARFKVGVDLDRGGILSYFEDKRDGDAGVGNLVNVSGVQPVYRGSGYTATLDGRPAAAHNLSADGRTLAVATDPCWNASSGSSMAASFNLRYELHDDYLAVAYSFNDRTGAGNPVSNHEAPALYAISQLSDFSCFTGSSGWVGGAVSTWHRPPFWDTGDAYKPMPSDETWCAWTNTATGHGLGLYNPASHVVVAGRVNPDTLTADPNSASRSYAAPIVQEAVVSGAVSSGIYYLTAGDIASMRRTFAAIRFGVADGQGLGDGDVRIDASSGTFSFSSFDLPSGSIAMNGRFLALNGGRLSEEFALVCRSNLAEASSGFLLPVGLSLEAAGENALALALMRLEDPPPSLFIFGLAERAPSFEARMLAKGFPETYVEPLARLHAAHPNWEFEPLLVSDMSWDAIVNKETTAGWNLVVHSSWAPGEWQALGLANYTPYYAENAATYDSGAWYQASRAAIAYFMDPRNFLNDVEVFMFETLGYDAASQTEEAVDKALSGSFMAGSCYDGGMCTFAALIAEAGASQGVSPVFLAGRLKQEQGGGTVQARGEIGDSLWALYADEDGKVGNENIWGTTFTRDNAATAAVIAQGRESFNGYYNFFNMGASGSGLFEIRYNAWKEAHDAPATLFGPWTTQERAIRGGAAKMKANYIDTCRHTRYLQKFSVLAEAGSYRWRQYMQNIASPLTEARSARDAYKASGAFEDAHLFLVPVYLGMPPTASPDPAGGNSVYSPSGN